MARMLGLPFMPWQQYVADVVMEIDPVTGMLWYSEYDLTVPRQSGKSTFVLAKAAHRCSATRFFGRRQQLVYTAQTRKDARKKFEEDFYPPLVEGAKRLHAKEHWNNGSEHFRFPNGSRFGIEATTEKAGHGGTLDEAFVDEAFAQTDGRLEQAFGPAMITRSNTQLGVISTAGWLDASPYLESKVSHGRQAVEERRESRIAYFEWSAEEDADPFDPQVWRGCMPALGHTISEQAIAGEIERFQASPEGLNGFKRAYLNLWVPKTSVSAVTSAEKWTEAADPLSEIVGVPALAVSMSPDQRRVSLGAAGWRRDGDLHIETVLDGEDGEWFLPDVARVARNQGAAVWLHPGHTAGTMLADLQTLGVDVQTLNGTEYSQACGSFYRRVNAGTLHYRPPQPELDCAVAVATRHQTGTAWKWGGDGITSLVAVTQALHGAQNLNQGGWAVSL